MEVNVSMIANHLGFEMQSNYKKFLGKSKKKIFFKPLFFEYEKKYVSVIVPLDIEPNDCISKNGIIQARKQFLAALKYAVEELDVKIVLLAASTKRLFGKNGEEKVNEEGKLDANGFSLSELYPNVLFTNGDNGTSVILNMEIDSVLEKASIATSNDEEFTENCKITSCSGAVVVNGLGLLGLDSLEYLIEKKLNENQIIVISNYTKDLKQLVGNRNIPIFPHIKEIKKNGQLECLNQIRAIINCTHNPTNLIDYNTIKHIQNGQPLYVIDVAVPYGFPEEEYLKCDNVFRQDGGNAYIEEGLEFFFNPEICGLTEKVFYGCFAEAMSLSIFMKEKPENREYLNQFDYFNVNKTTKQFVKNLFNKYGIGISPVPYNFMKRME